MEERLRYWNGYLLFYERMEEVRTPVSAKKSKVTLWKTPSDKTRQPSINVLMFLLSLIGTAHNIDIAILSICPSVTLQYCIKMALMTCHHTFFCI